MLFSLMIISNEVGEMENEHPVDKEHKRMHGIMKEKFIRFLVM